MIPKSALIGDDSVAVVNEDGLIDIKTVDIASETGGFLLIMDGLSEATLSSPIRQRILRWAWRSM